MELRPEDHHTAVYVQFEFAPAFKTDLADFICANMDGDVEIGIAVEAEHAGYRYTGGGGAEPIWTIAPGATLAEALSASPPPEGWLESRSERRRPGG